jgi:hypothetical protein
MDRDDLMWLAGLCEGEAYFGARSSGLPRMSIEATDRDVVGRAAMLMDGQGEASIGAWPCIIRLDNLVALLREAGYGIPDDEVKP